VDGGGGEAETGKHAPPIRGGGVCKDGSEVCLSLNPPKAYCARNDAVKEATLEQAFNRYETYEDKTREVYRPKGLLAYAAAARKCKTALAPSEAASVRLFLRLA
jgi:hypothetical protein